MMNAMQGNIQIRLDYPMPAETWEEIEDVIAAALYLTGHRGTIESESTGNAVAFHAMPEISAWLLRRAQLLDAKCNALYDRVACGAIQIIENADDSMEEEALCA